MSSPTQAASAPRQYRYYDLLMVAFVTVLLCSNLIGPAKVGYVTFPFALPFLGNEAGRLGLGLDRSVSENLPLRSRVTRRAPPAGPAASR